MENKEIMVSVCCTTYNQENYIKDALDGFLKQKTNFRYEIIVQDDASTDNTANIIKEYEIKYPDIIKPVYHKENQSSKGIKPSLLTYKKAQGKYIAFCEGDDYWIDENKLQLQFDYMENNPECTLCFHNAQILDMEDNSKQIFIPYWKEYKKYIKKDNKYNVGELELLDFIPTASFMFRTQNVQRLPEWFEKCYVGDWPLKLIMASFGYAYYIDKVMSVYRRNARGSLTAKNIKTEKESLQGKLYILERKKEFINWINEFTNYEYKDVFNMRIMEYEREKLMSTNQCKKVIQQGYLKGLSIGKKIKYILKIYMPNLVKIGKKILNRS